MSYLHLGLFLSLISFSALATSRSSKQISCTDGAVKITISTPCFLPNGMRSNLDAKFLKNSSKVTVVKNNQLIYEGTLNCYGVHEEDLSTYMTWFMNGPSYENSTIVFNASTYDSDVEYRESNQISLEVLKVDSPLKAVKDIELRHDVNNSKSKVKCSGF